LHRHPGGPRRLAGHRAAREEARARDPRADARRPRARGRALRHLLRAAGEAPRRGHPVRDLRRRLLQRAHPPVPGGDGGLLRPSQGRGSAQRDAGSGPDPRRRRPRRFDRGRKGRDALRRGRGSPRDAHAGPPRVDRRARDQPRQQAQAAVREVPQPPPPGDRGEVSGASDLFAAIKAGDEAAAARALDDDPSLLGARTENGESPLLLSAYYRQGRIARMFLARGAPVDLFEACAVGEAERVGEARGQEPGLLDAYAPDGFPPLTLASYFGHEEIVRGLLARGARVGLAATNAMAVAPLHAAVAGRHENIVRLLLAAGANPNAASHGG